LPNTPPYTFPFLFIFSLIAHVTFIIFLSLPFTLKYRSRFNDYPLFFNLPSLPISLQPRAFFFTLPFSVYIHTPFASFLPLLPKPSSIKPNIINTFYKIFSHQSFLDTFSPFLHLSLFVFVATL